MARGYRLAGNPEKGDFFQNRVDELVADSVYWQRRFVEFPELIDLSKGVS